MDKLPHPSGQCHSRKFDTFHNFMVIIKYDFASFENISRKASWSFQLKDAFLDMFTIIKIRVKVVIMCENAHYRLRFGCVNSYSVVDCWVKRVSSHCQKWPPEQHLNVSSSSGPTDLGKMLGSEQWTSIHSELGDK